MQLTAPKGKDYPPIKVWAVHIIEVENEEGVSPIEWMLLTTAEVHTFKDAKQRVEWYSGRWGIEVYHRTLMYRFLRFTNLIPMLISLPDGDLKTRGVKCG